MFFVGKIGSGEPSIEFVSYLEAVYWIEKQKEKDPVGVDKGDYYIDCPEGFSITVKNGVKKDK